MAIFEKRSKISRSSLQRYLKKEAPMRYSGVKKRLSPSTRMEMGKKLFGREYGPWISRQDFRTRIKSLEDKKKRLVAQRRSGIELRDIKRQIEYLKRIGGA